MTARDLFRPLLDPTLHYLLFFAVMLACRGCQLSPVYEDPHDTDASIYFYHDAPPIP